LNRTIQIAPLRKTIVVDATPAHAGEAMRNAVDGGWPTLLELFAKEIARNH